MKHFFDTSVLVAAFDDQDMHHERARPVFLRHAEGGAIATHTIAESFSILTGKRAWRPRDAFEILRTNTAFLDKITLTPHQYLNVVERAEEAGVRGGAIYDALILGCARRVDAGAIWTLNSRHFLLFAGDLTAQIREP
jgi:predicted nucleic acid-binding protein